MLDNLYRAGTILVFIQYMSAGRTLNPAVSSSICQSYNTCIIALADRTGHRGIESPTS